MRADPRLEFLMRRVQEVHGERFNGKRVSLLDIGCADCSFLNRMTERHRDKFESADGVDVSSGWFDPKALKGNGRVFTHDLQIGTGVLRPKGYQIITAWEVIEHLENIYAFLRNVRELLCPDGEFLLSSPNLLGLSRFVKGAAWIGTAEKDHKYLFDPLSLEMALRRAGFSRVNVRAYFLPSRGQGFDFANRMFSRLPGGGMLFARCSLKR